MYRMRDWGRGDSYLIWRVRQLPLKLLKSVSMSLILSGKLKITKPLQNDFHAVILRRIHTYYGSSILHTVPLLP
jgi:hypothetical protein